jgi:hypothetical protein
MKIFFKKYFFIVAVSIGWIFSGCSAGNKVIPDLFDITKIDTSNNILSLFNVYATGDTTFSMSVASLDSLSGDFKNTIINDTISIIAPELNLLTATGNGIYIKTYVSSVGTYMLDTISPNIKQAEVLFLKIANNIPKLYTMTHGYVQITEINTTDKTIKGNFDVNNFIKTTTNKGFRMKAYFYVKYI